MNRYLAVRGTVLTIVVALAAVTGCGDARGGDAPAGPPSAGQQYLNEIADRLRELGRHRFPDAYAGVEVRAEENTVLLYRRDTPGIDQAVRAEMPGAPVVFRDAPYTDRELTAWADTVRRELPSWEASGAPVHSVVVRHDGTCVELGTRAVDAVTAEAKRRHPDMPVRVVVDGPGWGAGR